MLSKPRSFTTPRIRPKSFVALVRVKARDDSSVRLSFPCFPSLALIFIATMRSWLAGIPDSPFHKLLLATATSQHQLRLQFNQPVWSFVVDILLSRDTWGAQKFVCAITTIKPTFISHDWHLLAYAWVIWVDDQWRRCCLLRAAIPMIFLLLFGAHSRLSDNFSVSLRLCEPKVFAVPSPPQLAVLRAWSMCSPAVPGTAAEFCPTAVGACQIITILCRFCASLVAL